MGNEDTCRSNKIAKSSSSSSSSRKRCEDCGNKAKRDCEHKRCRTCCKNNGFRCETHVKSTWVPLSKRHRQPIFSAYTVHQQQQNNGPISPRTYRSEQNQPTSLGHNFPGEASFPAVFRCIRLRSIDNNALDDYAYEASVNIGNRVFSGILYYQGHHRPYYNEEETANLVTNANYYDFLQQNPNVFVMGSTSNNNNNNICAATGNYDDTQYSNSHCCYALNNYSSAAAAAASQFL